MSKKLLMVCMVALSLILAAGMAWAQMGGQGMMRQPYQTQQQGQPQQPGYGPGYGPGMMGPGYGGGYGPGMMMGGGGYGGGMGMMGMGGYGGGFGGGMGGGGGMMGMGYHLRVRTYMMAKVVFMIPGLNKHQESMRRFFGSSNTKMISHASLRLDSSSTRQN
ncbi:MAG: hypothetical protein KMY53_13100 [Desulfarculus sp.]|nr:hypothetical protein [Desulfarculus sp.]